MNRIPVCACEDRLCFWQRADPTHRDRCSPNQLELIGQARATSLRRRLLRDGFCDPPCGILAKVGPLQLPSGTLFADRFEIDQPVGKGGMGTVYRAYDRERGTVVALKLLHKETGSPDETTRFAREAQILAELHHPAIVSYVAHGQTPQGQLFLAMEWLDGHDLAQHLCRGPLPLRAALLVVQRAAAALAVAHQRGIVHRDRTQKHKICLHAGHRALHERRTDHACPLRPHCPA